MRRLLEALLPTANRAASPDYTIVFPPTMLWANHQRPHHILTQLARHHNVRSIFYDWTIREERHEGGRLIVTKKAFRSRLHRRPLVYYFSIPEKLDELERHRLRPDLLVFELMDLPEEEFEEWKQRLPEALERADLIRTTNPEITDYLRRHFGASLGDKEISTSCNGVDLELFDPDRSYETPPELMRIDKPILGFYGNLDWWIDWKLVEKLALLPQYQVVVIGGTEGMPAKIPSGLRGSILWIDKKPIAEIPSYLNCFDAALYPFLVNEMTHAVDPLKVWEYLAFGKPVLATRTRFIEARADLFQLIDHGSVERSVVAALSSARDAAAVAARRKAAERRDWRVIADRLHREIKATLAK